MTRKRLPDLLPRGHVTHSVLPRSRHTLPSVGACVQPCTPPSSPPLPSETPGIFVIERCIRAGSGAGPSETTAGRTDKTLLRAAQSVQQHDSCAQKSVGAMCDARRLIHFQINKHVLSTRSDHTIQRYWQIKVTINEHSRPRSRRFCSAKKQRLDQIC